MGNIYEELGLDAKAVQDEAGAQTLSSLIAVGVYKAKVQQAYIRKTDSGAKMLAMLLNVVGEDNKPQEMFWETCIFAGDAKGNKPTFGATKTMPFFFQSCGEANPAVVMGPVKHKAETIQAMGLPSLAGKELTVGVKHEENLYEGSVSLRANISAFLDKDGKNSEGEFLAEKLAENLAKNPVKKLKVAAGAPATQTANASDAAASAASGW